MSARAWIPVTFNLLRGTGPGHQADDEAELTALSELRAGARQQAALGSVKANIGHAKAAAGAAGLIKTVLAVSTGVVPPASGVHKPHALISGGDARIRLPEAAEEWQAGTRLAASARWASAAATSTWCCGTSRPAGPAQERWLRSVQLLPRSAGKTEPGPTLPLLARAAAAAVPAARAGPVRAGRRAVQAGRHRGLALGRGDAGPRLPARPGHGEAGTGESRARGDAPGTTRGAGAGKRSRCCRA